MPFIISGGLKIFYDLTLGACFLWNKKSQEKELKGPEPEHFEELEGTESDSKIEEMK